MLSERDLEMNHLHPGAEPRDVPSRSSRETTRPQSSHDHGNIVAQQPGGTPGGRDRLPTPNERALPPRELTMPAGHPRLAELMGRRPQMGIYRRFGYLNTQNLLYMQAELVGLENMLKALQNRDAGEIDEQVPDDDGRRRAGDWRQLSRATITATTEPESEGSQGNASLQGASCCGHKRCEEWCCGESQPHEHCDQWNLAMKIREKLRRYNEALIQQMTLSSAGAPDSYDLNWIQRFLASDYFGMRGALVGEDQHLWDNNGNPGEAGELIALAPLPKRDPFTELIFKKLAKWILDPKSWWNKFFKNRSFEDKTLLRGTTAATSAVTATVPIVSVVVLYFTPDTNVRLILLAVFNLLAAFVLYIFTDAQPMQVFAASAAYSAVNIVFIGSNATASRF